jgi:aminomethyltransferase
MSPLSRTSALQARHLALGSKLEDWNGMGTAWTYAKDVDEEYAAIRTKAGLMDVSGLKKVHVTGPDATAVLSHATTRDLSKVYPGKSVYACMLNDAGYFTEDCLCYCLAPNAWLVVHGSGTGQEELARSAVGRNVSIRFDDDLHNISLQGPLAVEFLAQHVPGIHDLKYFHHMPTTLFGRHVMISRTGYTGERGYEIFVSAGRRAGLGHHPGTRVRRWASSLAASSCSTCCASSHTSSSTRTTTRRCIRTTCPMPSTATRSGNSDSPSP